MGSSSDLGHCEKIKKACATFGIPCELRVTSAHKGPDETLRIKAEYEGKCQEILMWIDTASCFRMTWQLRRFTWGFSIFLLNRTPSCYNYFTLASSMTALTNFGVMYCPALPQRPLLKI